MMYRVDSDNDKLIPLRELSLEPASLADRPELADVVLGSPDEILGELRREVFVIGKNLPLGDDSGRRVDMLGIDREGNSVLVVLDRGDEKAQLASAIMLAGMVATWEVDDFAKLLSPPRALALEEHLRVGPEELNRRQRLVFVGERCDSESAAAIEWLSAQGVDVHRMRLTVWVDPHGGDHYVAFSPVSAEQEDRDDRAVLREESGGPDLLVNGAGRGIDYLNEQIKGERVSRQRAEEALRASEERYQTLTRLSPVGIFHTDREGRYLYVNERWCEISGLNFEQAQGRGWMRGIHADDRDRAVKSWSESARDGTSFREEFRFALPGGGASWVLVEAEVRKGPAGEAAGFVGTVTELHRSEAASSVG